MARKLTASRNATTKLAAPKFVLIDGRHPDERLKNHPPGGDAVVRIRN